MCIRKYMQKLYFVLTAYKVLLGNNCAKKDYSILKYIGTVSRTNQHLSVHLKYLQILYMLAFRCSKNTHKCKKVTQHNAKNASTLCNVILDLPGVIVPVFVALVFCYNHQKYHCLYRETSQILCCHLDPGGRSHKAALRLTRQQNLNTCSSACTETMYREHLFQKELQCRHNDVVIHLTNAGCYVNDELH